MTSGESILGRQEAADERSRQMATDAGSLARNRAHTFLQRHSDLLDPQLVEQIGKNEFDSAYADAIQKRLEGGMNDHQSIAPGITVLLTKQGFNNLLGSSSKFDQELPYLKHYAGLVEAVDLDENIFTLELPSGVYEVAPSGFQFYGDDGVVVGGRIDGIDSIRLLFTDVLRIEGYSGERWQNIRINPDGTPKE